MSTNVLYLYENTPYMAPHEDEVARRWWRLPVGCLLPLQDGTMLRLLFAGNPGGSAGPDVRDAVLVAVNTHEQYVGDVEFHVRASDWVTHQHHTDPRYNMVILHVVLRCDSAGPTQRQDGRLIPDCSLYDLPDSTPLASQVFAATQREPRWPCQQIMAELDEEERFKLLQRAGMLRFEQKAHAFVETLHTLDDDDSIPDRYDRCLLPTLAEGLGYGRDRAFFRATGLRLLGMPAKMPEPLGHTAQPAPVDAQRLRVLRVLIEQWRHRGAWRTLHAMLQTVSQQDTARQLWALRSVFGRAGLSMNRADILICNVILPFAAAVAFLENDPQLFTQAQTLYREHPGLTSNRVTRLMRDQLRLADEPEGSCQQQGLHYIYQQTCREKCCTMCIVGKHDV
jgi:hypothetical protein